MSNQAVGLWASEVGPMRVGELAKLSNTPTRSLRYYEEQGIIKSCRLDNGYRTYDTTTTSTASCRSAASS